MPRVYNKHKGDAPSDAVYIGRPSEWGNPFLIGRDGGRYEVISKYRKWLLEQPKLVERVKQELKDKDLVCFCYPRHCHGSVLLKIANE